MLKCVSLFFLKAISHSFLTPLVQKLPQQETKEIGSYGMRALITEDQSHFDSKKTQGKDKLSFGLGSFLVAVHDLIILSHT